ncbi:MAG: cation transporter [Rhizobium rhizophilum]
MSAGCGHEHAPFDGMSDIYKRRLWMVIAINAGMFAVEMTAGQLARSQALQADALDFFADAVTYGISLAVIGASLKTRSMAAAAKGISLFLMGLWVFGSTIWRVFYGGVPEAPVMGIIGFLALAANVTSVLLLMSYKDGDANVRSVWLCSRNDAIGNVIVMIAAVGVWGTATAWPDLIVAGIMAGLFLYSSILILSQSLAEWRAGEPATLSSSSCGADGASHDHDGQTHTHDHAHRHS